jgi:anthranilate phosphoribosyltransferase
MSVAFKSYIAQVADGKPLSQDEARAAFDLLMAGEPTPSQMGGFLMALRVRGETVDEIAGAVQAMRAVMTSVQAPDGAIDLVGTGGDGAHTYNISTASAFVAAACGVPVAKHGNRGVSSRSGAADVLTALGINIDQALDRIGPSIAACGMGFMMAPKHHAAVRHVMPTRIELGTRTIFNILGPLANPARCKYQLIGVYDRALVQPIAEALAKLGSERALVVHGDDGLDEITLTGPTHAAFLTDGRVEALTIDPVSLGYKTCSLDDLRGGTPEDNAKALEAIFNGDRNAYAQTVELNAGAALFIAKRAATHAEGCAMARQAMSDGSAADVLAKLRAFTNA